VISRERFAQLFMEELRTQGVKDPIHFESEGFVLQIGDDSQDTKAFIGLQKPFVECQEAASDRCATIIRRYARLRARAAPPQDYAVAKPRLGLALSNKAFLATLRTLGEIGTTRPAGRVLAHRALTDDLIVLLGDDDGVAVRYWTEDQLSDYGELVEGAMGDATTNLLAKGLAYERIGSVCRVQMLDGYDAARIVLIEQLRGFPMKGEPVALAPDRDCLILTGSQDTEGLLQMAAMGHVRFEEGIRPISGRPVVLEGNAWKPFHPRPGMVSSAFVQLAHVYDEVSYWTQEKLLRRLCAKRKDEVAIAQVVRFPTRPSNQFSLLTRWEKGVETLLPKVDVVALVDRSSDTFALAEWDDVVRVVGHRMICTEDVPPRFRVAHFPSGPELAAMGVKMIGIVELMRRAPRPK
jgi:hypothetical protein